MNQALTAHTVNEARCYLMVQPCPACGKGPWELKSQPTLNPQTRRCLIAASCRSCGHESEFDFAVEQELPPRGVQSQGINLSDEPSKLIDLAQWLSLFHLLVETAAGAAATDIPESRRGSYQAALCLSEALKFYGDNEIPPESAFFSPAGLAVFRRHPEKFARQRLRDMQCKLPALPKMARRINRDDWVAAKSWWQFWRR
jgi:hypothetical protein